MRTIGKWLAKEFGFGSKKVIISIPLLFLFPAVGGALDFPTKPIQVVVGFAPGGSSDVCARLASDGVSKELGVPVVVVNKPGADSVIATTLIARSNPDGYAILAGSSSGLSGGFVTTPDITYKLSDFIPLARHIVMPLTIAVKKDAPWKTLPEFIEDARKHPGKYKIGGAMALQLLMQVFTENIQVIRVIYRGAAATELALLGGEVDVVGIVSNLMPHLEAGNVRILSGSRRLKKFSNYPTLAELGYPDANRDLWNGYLLPAGVPQPIFEILKKVFKKVVENPAIAAKLEEIGVVTSYLGPKEFGEYLQKEYEIYIRLGKKYKPS
jgi:tripartite-type tricarboxylate transporter receptor subunit TctC